MSSSEIQAQTQINDEAYLKIWETEQEHARTRWTVVTFFLSISFAILGFSFQSHLVPAASLAIRISGLLIYWFAYILLLHFYSFTKFLRAYLLEMENAGHTTLDIQGKAKLASLGVIKPLSTIRLLFFFGLIYTVGIITLWLLGL